MKTKGKIIALIVIALATALLIWFSIPLFIGISNIGNELGMVFAAAVIAVTIIVAICRRKGKKVAATVITIVGAVAASAVVAWAGTMTGFMVSGMAEKPHAEDATVVVLGCKVNGSVPSLHLYKRIEAAERYLKANPQANCIASGGKGDGENVSEAKVIYDYLVEKGIEPERIRIEDQSVNTLQNLQNSKAMIESLGWNPEVILVTDGFHQFRANRVAASLGMKSSPFCAEHTWHTFPANYSRELLAITRELVFK